MLMFCRRRIFALGVSHLIFLWQIFATAPKMGKTYFTFAIFFLRSCLRSCFWWTESKAFLFLRLLLRLASFFGGDYGPFILVPLKKTWGTLDFGIALMPVQSIPAQAYKCGSAGLWDCSDTTDKKTQSKSEAREATKERDAPCSTSVFTPEGGGGAGAKNIVLRIVLLFCEGHAAEN